ncbi:hypothetical protein Q0Z83_044620 [Actinoplanes sichuanensis]|uniref:Uncharacterized protein n=1 Tax=Actinoplanes sichuanensis TaxID=512349 RepID=A0ABW4APC1_9ACTN|nr:hypothetical protein [Actinoplanes sichuanensis]BEL06271.1 hypothetical protein Q0Z83_044620 [Actinoplanes sichuanensis]
MNLGKARRRLRLHAVTVLVLLLAYVVLAPFGAPLLLPMLALTALGMPWSIPFLWDPYMLDDAHILVRHLVMVAPAILNVLLHGAVHLVRSARVVNSR